MMVLDLKLSLPKPLIEEAKAAGLLTPEAIEKLLRAEIRRRKVDKLFESADRLAGLDLVPLSDQEIEAEIQAARQSK
jgi:hypothetical protein